MRMGPLKDRSKEVPPASQALATPRLTPREDECLRLLTLGQCNKEIAAAMSISPRTVKFHMTNLFIKFGVTSRLELLALISKPRVQRP